MWKRALFTAAFVGGVMVMPGQAQEKNSVAVGVNYTTHLSPDSEAHGTAGVGLSWRIGHSESGWGWTYGLGWYDTHLKHVLAGANTEIGELHVRPIVAGYGYTHRLSPRWYVTGDVVGGAAFTTLSFGDDVQAPSARSFGSHFALAPIVRPEIKTWYDINRRFGVSVSGSYAIVRPKIAINTPGGSETFRVRADTFALSTGIVYRIF